MAISDRWEPTVESLLKAIEMAKKQEAGNKLISLLIELEKQDRELFCRYYEELSPEYRYWKYTAVAALCKNESKKKSTDSAALLKKSYSFKTITNTTVSIADKTEKVNE